MKKKKTKTQTQLDQIFHSINNLDDTICSLKDKIDIGEAAATMALGKLIHEQQRKDRIHSDLLDISRENK